MFTHCNLAKEYVSLFRLEEQAINETPAQFRERIARTLYDMGEYSRAHEVLYNDRMLGSLFARSPLDGGFGDEFITRMANCVEMRYQWVQGRIQAHQLRVARIEYVCSLLRLSWLSEVLVRHLDRRHWRFIDSL